MVQAMSSGKRINNFPFDMARVMSFEGDTGPYLQYSHARVNSILRKAGVTAADLQPNASMILIPWTSSFRLAALGQPSSCDGSISRCGCDCIEPVGAIDDVNVSRLAGASIIVLLRLTQVIGPHVSRDAGLSRAALFQGAHLVPAKHHEAAGPLTS